MPAAHESVRSAEVEVPGYRMLRLLATGGMGSVFEAERLTTGKRFAVKVIRADLAGDGSYLARFEREVKALRSIRHPNVVDVYEWSLPGPAGSNEAYVVMELLHGDSLGELLRRTERMPARQVVAVMLQVLDGLAAAHAVGVIHRDLGPSNVFLSIEPKGRLQVKLLDFGLARPVDEADRSAVTQKGTFVGKPGFVAPEMFRGERLDARSDLFACGMLMFQMLTGQLPYRERRANLLWMERYAEREPGREYPGPRSLEPDVPAELDAVVVRAVRKRPEDRFGSARDMQAVLLAMYDSTVSVEEEITTTIRGVAALAARATACSEPAVDRTRKLGPGGREQVVLRPNDEAARVAQSLRTEEIQGTPAPPGSGQPAAASRTMSPAARGGALALAAVAIGLLLVLALRSSTDPAGSAPRSSTDAVLSSLPDAVVVVPGPPAEPSVGAVGRGASPVAAVPLPPGSVVGATVDGSGAAPQPVPPAATVRLTFVDVPPGADLRLDGRPVPAGGVAVPRSDEPVRLSVTVHGGAYRPFVRDVVPSADQEIRLRLQRVVTQGAGTSSTADAGGAASTREAGTVTGRFGTVFASEFDPPP